MVVLLSGSGSNLQALIDHCVKGTLPADIVAVISNRRDALGLQRARNAGIPAQYIDHRDFPDRAGFDEALASAIDSVDPDLVVLAGFMRILTPAFVNRYEGRLINIHPSLLPKHKGLNTHQRAIDERDEKHGASVHFVTAELDGGPVVLQASIAIKPDHTADSLATDLLDVEHRIYPQVAKWFAEKRLILTSTGPELDGSALTEPLQWETLPDAAKLTF